MKIHHYNPETGIIDFTIESDAVPFSFTNLPLPEITLKQALKFVDDHIEIVSNYGVVYNTLTKEPKQVNPGYELQENETIEQPLPFSVWSNQWVYSENLEKNYVIEKLTEVIEDQYRKSLWKGVVFQNYRIRVDEKSKNELTSAAVLYILFNSYPSVWITEHQVDNDGNKIEGTDNTRLELTSSNIQSFFLTLATFYSTSFFKRRNLIDSLYTKSLDELKTMESQTWLYQ